MDPHLLLAVAEGYGQTAISGLLDPDADARALLADPSSLPPAVRRRIEGGSLAGEAEAWLRAAARLGQRVLTPASPGYPERLRQLPLRPLVLFCRGDPSPLRSRCMAVALVGSRTPTPYGIAAAEDFAAALARAGVVLWSGLAVGIDAIAHRAALRAGVPTVAVLAGGLDGIYPSEHRRLAEHIAEAGGTLLSEAPPGRRARRGHFPRRNRILAGSVGAVLVLEAGRASGTLHTAHHAADAGVPVFAVPGPYTSPRSQGCHSLIAEGAQIAPDPEDLLRRLGVEQALRPAADELPLELGADESAILQVLERGPRPNDLVAREARLHAGPFATAVLALTDKGLVRSLPGDLLALARPVNR